MSRLGGILTGASVAAVVALLAAASIAEGKTFKSGFMSYVSTPSTAAPGTGASVAANCPGNRRVTGTGATLGGPARADSPVSRIASLSFGDDDADGDRDDRAISKAYNGSGKAAKLTTFAACLAPQAGGSALSYNFQPSASNPLSGNIGTGQTTTCSGRVVGGGELFVGPPQEETLRGNGPEVLSNGKVDPSTWQASIGVSQWTTNHFAYIEAACITGNALKIRAVYKPKVIFQDQVRKVSVKCPRAARKGWKVLSGGWSGATESVLASAPFDDRDRKKVPDDGWQVKVKHFMFGNPTALVAYAICGKRR